MSRRWGIVVWAVAVAAGCAMGGLDSSTREWDSWIGQTKDERVRHLGIPNRCHLFQSGGELCEWPVQMGGDTVDTLGMMFDKTGTACQWTYRGFYGDQKSQASCPYP